MLTHIFFLHIYSILNLANFRPMHIMDNGHKDIHCEINPFDRFEFIL